MEKNNLPLISVIVPIYNVEKYIRRCLDSLAHQTLKQIEVICIDDGSTDRSGAIADEYESSEYPIFRVIHTDNRGLSAARNRGLDEARAEWIMFVDSDDWVDERFCEIPYRTAIENQVDLVIFDFEQNGIPIRLKRHRELNEPVGVVDEYSAFEYGKSVTWNKIYRKILFTSIRYPEGRLFEDIATTHKLIHAAKRLMMISDKLYFNQKRKGSITQTKSQRNKRGYFLSVIERQDDYYSYGYSSVHQNDYLCGVAISFLANVGEGNDALNMKAKEILKSTVGIPNGMSIKQKIALSAWRIDENFFYFLCRKLKWK